MKRNFWIRVLSICFCYMIISSYAFRLAAQPLIYRVEYGPRPTEPPSLEPLRVYGYLNLDVCDVVIDNWYYASRERADSVKADVFIVPGGSTSDIPFYDGSLDSYVDLLRNPGRPTFGFCAGLQFLLMAQGGICARRSGEHGNEDAHIFRDDEIFDGCPNPYNDRAAHSYSIVDVPDCYDVFARTKTCYVSFIKHRSMPLYGSQLHIESMNNPNSGGPAILHNFFNTIVPRVFHGISELHGYPDKPGIVRLSWWPAKTENPVEYLIYHALDSAAIDYNVPEWISSDLEMIVHGLDPESTHYFAVRCRMIDPLLKNNPVKADFENDVVLSVVPRGSSHIVFQNGLNIGDDVYESCEATVMYQKYPDSNYGSRGASTLELTWWNSGLVQFKDIEKYLTGKQILSAKLTFIFAGGVDEYTTEQNVASIQIFPILKSWREGRGVSHSTAYYDEATWNSARHGRTMWDLPGCRGESDRTPQPLASYVIKGNGEGIEFDGTVELPPELVQGWVDNPESNNGLLFEKEDSYPNNDHFYFEDDDDEWFMNHPRLIVQYIDKETTLVTNPPNRQPETFALHQNYPNPFNQATSIPFTLKSPGKVSLRIYNLLGHEVRTLYDGELSAGEHRLGWDGQDVNSLPVASGVYLYELSTGDQHAVKRLCILR
ncbi:DNRLRE domain-containing protein [candidate division KSB1 bacterium]|nr:DNRLRE domain-containing protein [candidate division KSB1 bacterium]